MSVDELEGSVPFCTGVEQPLASSFDPDRAPVDHMDGLHFGRRIGNETATKKPVHGMPEEQLPCACAGKAGVPANSGMQKRRNS